jgi:uncharacterized protein YdhG (YjbR/CyaY superfamily)
MKKAAYGGFVIPKDPDEYIDAVPEPARSTLKKLRKTIQSLVPPGTTETISYRMPAFRYKRILLIYGAFADHCSLFPMDASLITKFAKDLKGFSTAKGTIRFPVDNPLPATLLKKIVNARVAQNEKGKKR